MDDKCKNCGNEACIFQSEIKRSKCSFFMPKSDKGQWALIIIGDNPERKYMCEQCMGTACEKTPYCPYCGVKMEGEDNNG